MKFPGKKTRAARKNARRNIDFDHYNWDNPKERGWHPLVVLNAKESETKAGDPMWLVDFGIDNPDGSGSRIRWRVPSTFPPKVIMCMEVLLPEFCDAEEDQDIDPKVMMFRSCVGLIDEDPEFVREDGQPAWELIKIIKSEDADAELGAGWHGREDAEDDGDSEGADDDDLFGDEEVPY